MCGIVGYVGRQPAVPIVVKGINQLLYRGYDSAGVSGVVAPGKIMVVKQVLLEADFLRFAGR